MNLLLLATIVFVPMLFEAVLSRRNERELRSMGAAEPHDDVYWIMQLVYPLAFVAMLVEGWLLPATLLWLAAAAHSRLGRQRASS